MRGAPAWRSSPYAAAFLRLERRALAALLLCRVATSRGCSVGRAGQVLPDDIVVKFYGRRVALDIDVLSEGVPVTEDLGRPDSQRDRIRVHLHIATHRRLAHLAQG